MSAWAVVLAVAAYLVSGVLVGIRVAGGPLHPIRFCRRKSIAQALCNQVEFFGKSPVVAWREYEAAVGAFWLFGWETIHEALWEAHARALWRETIGHGLDIVSEIPDRLVLTKPHTRTAA